MELDTSDSKANWYFDYFTGIPVGDSRSRHRPEAIQMALHPRIRNCFVQGSLSILAVVTEYDLRIFHEVTTEHWQSAYTIGWDDRQWSSFGQVTCIAWCPNSYSLFAGDTEGNIIVLSRCKLSKTYSLNCVARDTECLSSISVSGCGAYLAASYKTYMKVMNCHNNNLRFITSFRKSSGDSIVRFNRYSNYLFMASKTRGIIKVFTNLTPELTESSWRQILVATGGMGCLDMAIWNKSEKASTYIITTGDQLSFWLFCPEPGGTIRFEYVAKLEQHMTAGNARCACFLNKNNFVVGTNLGNLVPYTLAPHNQSEFKSTYNKGRIRHGDQRRFEGGRFYPLIHCMLKHNVKSQLYKVLVGANMGYVYLYGAHQSCCDIEEKEADVNAELAFYKRIDRISYAATPSSATASDVVSSSSLSTSEYEDSAISNTFTPISSRVSAIESQPTRELEQELQLNLNQKVSLITDENGVRRIEIKFTIDDQELTERLLNLSF